MGISKRWLIGVYPVAAHFVAVQHGSKYGSAHPPVQAFFVAMQQI
jgi:hypothetical protein